MILMLSMSKMTPWLIFRSQTPSNISDKEEHITATINGNTSVTCAGAGAVGGGVLCCYAGCQTNVSDIQTRYKEGEDCESQNWNIGRLI